MWADKSNPKLRRCRQRISPFFFLFISLSLRLLLFNVNVFPLQASLFFFPVTIARSRMHTYTRRLLTLGGVRASTPQGPRGASSNLFLLSLGFFSSYFSPSLTLRGDQNERLRIEGILRTWIQSLQLSRNSGGDLSAAAHDGTVGTRRRD